MSIKDFIAILVVIVSFIVIKYDLWWYENLDDFKERVYNIFSTSSMELFTSEELRAFTGERGGPIYLSILGKVFDVSKGRKHYGKNGSYSFFAGIDASKAFVTGDFSDAGLTDDISNLTINELGDLNDWLNMYKKDYIYKGKLIGRFYDNNGLPTEFMKVIDEKLRLLQNIKKHVDFEKQKFPPCNVEWTPETGSRFWCSTLSGGITRNWVGVPRKFYKPGSTKYRCACINPEENAPEGKFVQYEGCPPDATSCYVKT